MTNEEHARVMRRLHGLRALAANAGTQKEAESAAAQAAAIIARYGIDESVSTVGIELGEPLWEGKQSPVWLAQLAIGLCAANGCAVVTHYDDGRVFYRVAGRPDDVAIVRYMFAWLMVEIERLSTNESGRSAKDGFRRGAVAGVHKAMRKATNDVHEDAPTGGSVALAIVDRGTLAMDHLTAALDGKWRTKVAGAPRDDEAYGRGKKAGGKLAPKSGLGTGATKMLGAKR